MSPEQPNPFAAPQTHDPVGAQTAFQSEHPEAMRRVRTGLGLVYGAICGMILCVLSAGIVGGVLAAQVNAQGLMLVSVLSGLVLVGAIVYLVGMAFCIAAPSESGAKGLAIAAICLYLAAFVSAFAGGFFGVSFLAMQVVQILSNLVSLASFVLFLLFMRKFALYIGRSDVAGRAMRTLVVGSISAALLLGGVLASPVLLDGAAFQDEGPAMAFGIAMVIGGIGSLVSLIMYANTATYLRKAIVLEPRSLT